MPASTRATRAGLQQDKFGAAAVGLFPSAGVDTVVFGAFWEKYLLGEYSVPRGAQLVDPRATLCSGLDCPATGADGLPLYLDSNHLRAGYARERASFVDEMLLGP
jgi:hypothetical protein